MSTISTSTINFVEYVSEADTLPDSAVKESTSASLRTSNAILLGILLLASYILNLILITTVVSHPKLRQSTIYLLLSHFSCIHILNLTFTVLLSLIYVANEAWVLGLSWCRVNATMNEFCQLYTMMSLMLMAAERAVGLVMMGHCPDPFKKENKSIIGKNRLAVTSATLAVVCLAIAIPTATQAIPVKPFKNRYVCAIDAYCPIAYPIARMIIYVGCLIVTLVSVGAILKKRGESSLPSQSREYSDFIKKNRAHQEWLSRAKMVILLLIVFLLVEGPYATLGFIYELSNSSEVLLKNPSDEIQQDADILITWLKFVYPLFSAVIIFTWCNDIWTKTKELFCCQSYDPPTIGHYMGAAPGVPGVMTLVATPEGLQLRMPPHTTPIYPQQNLAPTPTPYSVPRAESLQPPQPQRQNSVRNFATPRSEQLPSTSHTPSAVSVQSEPIRKVPLSTSKKNKNAPAPVETVSAPKSKIPKPSQPRAQQPKKKVVKKVKPAGPTRR